MFQSNNYDILQNIFSCSAEGEKILQVWNKLKSKYVPWIYQRDKQFQLNN